MATCNRVAPLENLLQSLRNQSYRQFETIIVDQNPEGFLDQLLATFADLDLKVIRIAPEGVSNARNVGLLQATKDVVAFPDDDCWYGPATLHKVNDILCANPQMEMCIRDRFKR